MTVTFFGRLLPVVLSNAKTSPSSSFSHFTPDCFERKPGSGQTVLLSSVHFGKKTAIDTKIESAIKEHTRRFQAMIAENGQHATFSGPQAFWYTPNQSTVMELLDSFSKELITQLQDFKTSPAFRKFLNTEFNIYYAPVQHSREDNTKKIFTGNVIIVSSPTGENTKSIIDNEILPRLKDEENSHVKDLPKNCYIFNPFFPQLSILNTNTVSNEEKKLLLKDKLGYNVP